MHFTKTLVLLAMVVAMAGGHFFLQFPSPLGYDELTQAEGPCGGFNPLNATGPIDWPVGGLPVAIISTHNNVNWEINAALLIDGAQNWFPLVRPFFQTGYGNVCFSSVPGNRNWVGQRAVVQLIQHSADGSKLFQCTQVLFRAGGPESIPLFCRNDEIVSHEPIVEVQTTGPSMFPTPILSTPALFTTVTLASPDATGQPLANGQSSSPIVVTGASTLPPKVVNQPTTATPSTSAAASPDGHNHDHNHDHNHENGNNTLIPVLESLILPSFPMPTTMDSQGNVTLPPSREMVGPVAMILGFWAIFG